MSTLTSGLSSSGDSFLVEEEHNVRISASWCAMKPDGRDQPSARFLSSCRLRSPPLVAANKRPVALEMAMRLTDVSLFSSESGSVKRTLLAS